MKLCWPLGLMLLLLMSPMLIAQDDKKEDAKQEDATVAERFNEAASAYGKVDRQAARKARKAEDKEEKDAIAKEAAETKAELFAEIVKLSEEAEEDKDAVTILEWIMSNGDKDAKNAAIMKIMTDYVESEEVANFARSMMREPGARSESILRKLIKDNPHDRVKAFSTMSLAVMLNGLSNASELKGSRRARFIKDLGDGGEEFLEKWTKEAIEEEITSLYKSVINDYGDLPYGRGTLGEVAEKQLFMLNLQIGKVAPDIEGTDLDEVDFKLSDYRGKVVVIDFWGDW